MMPLVITKVREFYKSHCKKFAVLYFSYTNLTTPEQKITETNQ